MPAVVGLGFGFSGTGAGLEIPPSPGLNVGLGEGFTIEAWVSPGDNVNYRPIVEWATVGNYGVHFGVNPWSHGSLYADIFDSTGGHHFIESAPGSIVTNQLQHVALTYHKPSGVARLLINGALASQASIGSITAQTSYGFYIGYRPPGSPYGPIQFMGILDEVSLYNRALTPEEIAAIYTAGSAGKCLAPPTILTQPADLLVMAGSNVTFNVTADGVPPLAYQWTFNDTPLAGATSASLALPNVSGAQSGLYAVIVSNVAGAVTSTPARLHVRYLLVRAAGQVITGGSATYTGSVSLTMETAFPNGSIFYTRDGSTPNYFKTFYTGAFTLRRSATLRAVTYSADFSQGWEAPAIQFNLVPLYPVMATSRGGGTVELSPSPGPYLSNTLVTATATAAEGWTFLEWLGDAAGTNPSVQLAVTRPLSIEALFGTPLNTTVTGAGSVRAQPTTAFYPYGTVVRLVAVPDAGQRFAVWGNAASGSANPLSFAVTNPAPTVTALFVPLDANQHTLTVIPSGRGSVSVQPSANAYAVGTGVTLLALPEQGQAFLGWSGDATGEQNPLLLTMDASKVITARFTRRPTLQVDSPPASLPEEGCRLSLVGEFGTAYQLEVSTNLTEWSALATATNAHGRLQLTDPSAKEFPHRFYRALEQ